MPELAITSTEYVSTVNMALPHASVSHLFASVASIITAHYSQQSASVRTKAPSLVGTERERGERTKLAMLGVGAQVLHGKYTMRSHLALSHRLGGS